MKIRILCAVALLAGFIFSGCAGVQVPTNTVAIDTPFGKVKIEHPQDFIGSNVVSSFSSNAISISFGYIKTANSPEVIDKAAAGQVAIIKAHADSAEKLMKAGAELVGQTGAAAAKKMVVP